MPVVLPISLPVGYVLIYGEGLADDGFGIQGSTIEFKWGQVVQAWDGGDVFVYGNPTVMFKEEDVENRLFFLGYPAPYTLIQAAKLVGTQAPLL